MSDSVTYAWRCCAAKTAQSRSTVISDRGRTKSLVRQRFRSLEPAARPGDLNHGAVIGKGPVAEGNLCPGRSSRVRAINTPRPSPICRWRRSADEPNDMMASASGCFSPEPCLSAPGQRFPSATGPFPITAPWFRSPGPRGRVRGERNRCRTSDLVPPSVAMTVDLLCAVLAAQHRHAICYTVRHGDIRTSDCHRRTDRPHRPLAPDREDDKPFLERLSRAMETRGFTVTSCDSVSDGLAQIGRAAAGLRRGGFAARRRQRP